MCNTKFTHTYCLQLTPIKDDCNASYATLCTLSEMPHNPRNNNFNSFA